MLSKPWQKRQTEPARNGAESRRLPENLGGDNFKDPLIKPICPKRGKVISNYCSAEFEGFLLGCPS